MTVLGTVGAGWQDLHPAYIIAMSATRARITSPAMLNLTGLWNGSFGYRGEPAPVPFTARLQHVSDQLTGMVEERATVGPAAGRIVTATVMGRIDGTRVRFLKTYDRHDDLYDAVQYAGFADRDGALITGGWMVVRSWTGPFTMVRQLGSRRAERLKQTVTV